MNKRLVWWLFLLSLLVFTACDKEVPAPVFHIRGYPDPVLYGGCGDSLTLRVTGPGDNIRVDSIIASYNLYNSSGVKVRTGSIRLEPMPGETPTSYAGSVSFSISTSSGPGSAPESALMEFGEGRVEFGAFVDARFITSPAGGPYKPVGHTETLSLPVIPCLPTPTAPPPPTATPVPPYIAETPVPSGAEAPSIPPPSCSVEPNNPNCVP